MSDTILIQGARLIDPGSNRDSAGDLRLGNGAITAFAQHVEPAAGDTIFDGTGLWICPGLTDIHTHLRDFKQKDKEDIASGTAAAAAGGYTTVFAMANTDPPVDNASTLSVFLNKIAQQALVKVLPVASVTVGLKGCELTNMWELAALGAVAFSDDGMTVSNLLVLRRALEYARSTGRVIISHAEDRDLSEGGAIQEGALSTRLGLPGIPQASETAAIAREIEIVRLTGARYHFTHLSCARSVELVRRAKQDGLSITCDTTPHHLALSVDDIPGFDTNYKMKPPLRLPADVQALIDGLKDGTIDAIATDHAPHTGLDKHTTMDEAAVGITGLETAFSLCLEKLVVSGALTPLKLVAAFTTAPAAIFNPLLPAKAVQAGQPADLTIIDPQLKWIYDAKRGLSRAHNSPFSGKLMTGKPLLTICGGTVVYRDDERLSARCKTSPERSKSVT